MGIPFPHVPGVTHRYVTARGVRFHVAEAGEGEPLVMVHGWPQHWFAWRHLIPPLAERYRVICPDLRGHGWSDAPPDGYDKENLAADLIALMDAMDLERVRLVSHDWGAFASFLLCLAHPQRVERLLALGIPPPWPQVGVGDVSVLWRFAYQQLIAAPLLGRLTIQHTPFVRTLIRMGSGRAMHWSDADLEAFEAPLREAARANASVSLYRTFLLRELAPLVRGRYRGMRLTTPTLLLSGGEDRAIRPGDLGGYEPYADHMSVEVLPGVGHFIPEESPGVVLDRALAFFAPAPRRTPSRAGAGRQPPAPAAAAARSQRR